MIENIPDVTEEILEEMRRQRLACVSAATALAGFNGVELEGLDEHSEVFKKLKTAVQPLVETPDADRPNYLNGTAISSEQFSAHFDNL